MHEQEFAPRLMHQRLTLGATTDVEALEIG
jgi:hypothetical protein